MTLLPVIGWVALGMLVVALLLVFVRMAKGPTAVDRVVALDLAVLLLVGIGALGALITGKTALIDLGLALGLMAFLATLALARHFETVNADKDAETAREHGE